MINIFIGYDDREKVAYHVLSESILRHSSKPVSITPVKLSTIKDDFVRAKVPNQSTDFAFSRFIIPHLSNYQGWSLFMDCDMLMRTDIAELWSLRDDNYAVQVCKHDYQPKETTKFLGQQQQPYAKKNWSSFMLFNNKKCTSLTPNYVNRATGLELHQFKWLESDDLIGDLPLEWNWLVGEYKHKQEAKNVHYTLGGPYFQNYMTCDYADEWFNVYASTVKIEL